MLIKVDVCNFNGVLFISYILTKQNIDSPLSGKGLEARDWKHTGIKIL